jgi:hypothetical protein
MENRPLRRLKSLLYSEKYGGFMRTVFIAALSVLTIASALHAGCNAGESIIDGGVQDASTADSGQADSGSVDGSSADSGDGGSPDGSKTFEPDQSFFIPVSPKNLQLSLKGLINSYDDVVNGSDTEGIGSSTVTLGAKSIEMNETARAFTYTFPDDYPRQDWRGEAFVIIDMYHTREGGADYAWYDTVRFYVPVKDMLAAKASGKNVFAYGSMGAAYTTDMNIKVRKDKVYMHKDCYNSVADSTAAASRYFVNPEDNTGFAAGENIKIWGNIAVTDDKTVIASRFSGLTEDNGQLCRYYKDSQLIAKEQYYKDINVDFDLDCALPDGFLDPPADDYAIGMFKGLINDGASENQIANGVSSYKVSFGGKNYSVDDYSAYSINFMNGKIPMIGTLTLGSVTTLATGHYTYLASEFYTTVQDLKDLKSSSSYVMNFSAYNIIFDIAAMEQKDAGKKSYFKQCIKVVIADDAKSALFSCHDGNTDFSAGENIQEASRLVLTTDPGDIAAYTGSADPCSCYDEAYNPVDCADFDKM